MGALKVIYPYLAVKNFLYNKKKKNLQILLTNSLFLLPHWFNSNCHNATMDSVLKKLSPALFTTVHYSSGTCKRLILHKDLELLCFF